MKEGDVIMLITISCVCSFVLGGVWGTNVAKEKIETIEKEVEIIKEVEVIKIVEKEVEKDCDCTKFASEHCNFDLAYEAVKDSIEFNKGTRFILSEKYFIENKQFCVEVKDDDWNEFMWPCLDIKTILDKRFFKPVK